MAEAFQRNKQYSYEATSMLVIEGTGGKGRPRNEGTGEVESMKGRLDTVRMGDRIDRSAAKPALDASLAGATSSKHPKKRGAGADSADGTTSKRNKRANNGAGGDPRGVGILEASLQLESFDYRPQTADTRAAYGEILAVVQTALGDQPADILRGAADEVIASLKNSGLRDPQRLAAVRDVVGAQGVGSAVFDRLVSLGKRLVDYSDPASSHASNGADGISSSSSTQQTLDEEAGVAVVYGSEEDGSSEDQSESDSDSDAEEMETTALRREGGAEDSIDAAAGGPDSAGAEGGLSVHDIDAHWLQRQLGVHYTDANESAQLAADVLQALQLGLTDERACENALVESLGFDKFSLVQQFMRHKEAIYYCTLLRQAADEAARGAIEATMAADGGKGAVVLQQLQAKASAQSWTADRIGRRTAEARREAVAISEAGLASSSRLNIQDEDEGQGPAADSSSSNSAPSSSSVPQQPTRMVDLDPPKFRAGGHMMTSGSCKLPTTSWRAQKKGYEEVHVPAVRPVIPEGEKLVEVSSLPSWTHATFPGIKTLNRIQSRMVDAALHSNENLLLCAPTGAGKTNVALMAMLQELSRHRRDDGSFDLDAFKIVYVAPMKALVQENVLSFGKKLAPLGVNVRELSGDQNLTQAQIADTQVIVTTPEKWDIVTRKAGDRAYTQLVRLVIIDEIHLLHDERGPVLEALVARVLRQVETTQDMVRLVGLSATLPNFEDVASFLRVNPEKGLFFFDATYRPVPLQQQYIGITEKKALKRFQLMNEVCYEKVLQQAGKNQVLIFTHSRADTVKTAQALRDLARENGTLNRFVAEGSASAEILDEEADTAKSTDLADLLKCGFGVHHAGLVKGDRSLVEDLFSDKHLQVLVSTATLAWGVNLPCHTVILKGTQMYSPEQGRWAELSPLDVLQMLGRAGRYGLDTEGEGIIMTQHSELQYYLSLTNQQLPIESQMVRRLPDMLNAEVVLGTVTSLREAAAWLGYSYLFVRMLRNPETYGVAAAELEKDPVLMQVRLNLAHSAATVLEKSSLIKYDRKSGALQATTLGRVASHYYVAHDTMRVFAEFLRPSMSDVEVFRLFALSGEFKNVHVKEEEKLEVAKLLQRVPVPVKEGPDEPAAKVNALLQSFISRLKLDGFAMVADMTYIQQSACRLMRAIFEICLKRGWAALSVRVLTICQMLERRSWQSQSPLRQFGSIPEVLLRKLEKADLPWVRFLDLKAADLGELVKIPKMGKTLHKYVHMFPRCELNAHVLPLTRSLLKVHLTITPDFQFDTTVHNGAVMFHIICEDGDGESILHHETLTLHAARAATEHTLSFCVPVSDPPPPQYFVRVVADRWLHAETVLPVSFQHMVLPQKFPPPTQLLDLQPLPTSVLPANIRPLFPFKCFNALQTQTFSALFEGDASCLVCAPAGAGKKVCAELAILQLLLSQPEATAVYLCVKQEQADAAFNSLSAGLATHLGVQAVQLTGETAPDLKALERGSVVVATAAQWDSLSRRWKQRKNVQQVALYVADGLHLLAGRGGSVLEVVLSRARYVAAQCERQVRLVGLSVSVANARDLGDWLGAAHSHVFNFSPDVRPVPLEVKLTGFDSANTAARMLSMSKHAYHALARLPQGKPSIVFVPSRKQAQLSAIDFLAFATAAGTPRCFLNVAPEKLAPVLESIKEGALRECLAHGVGYLHTGLLQSDRARVEGLYRDGVLSVLVVPHDLCWSLPAPCFCAVIMDTVTYDGHTHQYVDYSINDVLQMVGAASRPQHDESAKCLLLVHSPKKEYLKRLLHEALPVESMLDHDLHDHFCAEVVSGTLESKQDAVDYLTWTYFYRRLTKNPNFYGVSGTGNAALSDHLSELVENTITELEESKCVAVEDDVDLQALNLGMVAAYYYIHYTTTELFASSITERTKVRGAAEILCAASEFSELPLRQGEEKQLRHLQHALPHRLPDSASKALVLLSAHFSRLTLPAELAADLRTMLRDTVKLVQALVDVVASQAWLKPALAAMELGQMAVQGMWDKDSPLLQIPHFDADTVVRCQAAGAESVFDVLEMEDDVRETALQLSAAQMSDVALFCNAYPNIECSYETDLRAGNSAPAGSTVTLSVALQRDLDEEDEEEVAAAGKVVSSRFPGEKTESWWLVLGDKATNALLCIKRVSLSVAGRYKLQFTAPEVEGSHALTLYLMSDSYLGCDQEYSLDVTVTQAEMEESSSEDEN